MIQYIQLSLFIVLSLTVFLNLVKVLHSIISYSIPSSTLVQCPNLINPDNGRVSMSGNSSGDTATYICDPDFELVGNSTRVCGDDGQWSGEAPMCIRK